MNAPRIVCIGGGHGLSAALGAAKRLTPHVTAIVTVADDGGSSGILRAQLGIAPPGDLRMAIAALASDPERAELLQYRFREGELAGHPLGNLLIAALTDIEGDLVRALDDVGKLASATGRVLPAAPVALTLHAQLADGRKIKGQVAIATSGGPVERVWVEPAAEATQEALEALEAADLVILGPGSLFTSVIATLCVGQIAHAVARAKRIVFVMNLCEQTGETPGMDADAHLEALRAYLPGVLVSAVIAHDGDPVGAKPIAAARNLVNPVPVVKADVASHGVHDSDKLAAILKTLV